MTARKLACMVALLAALAGCATTTAPSLFGNFLQNPAQTNDKKMADDLVKKLVLLYPPASTRFDLQHTTSDYFGTYLVDTLRGKGYAVLEFKSGEAKSGSTTGAEGQQKSTVHGMPLAYIVDQAKGSDLYRVTVQINRQQSLDRLYQMGPDGELYPAGYWVRKE